ncbi:hypothetical protein BN2475_1030002 [Paraburkholderia ribeironis]|uniref:HTH-like domain-containing protein n=1 Tax=Paraburkholderia ribeironis TaxID=1247936 RepID=A0A1N7SLZ6_9BURK|nr:hypothetical protein BN2475_1030002 [Paraburkholderia ribeironis]
MITFIDDHRQVYGVEPICRVLPIAPSTYYQLVARRADPARLPARAQRDAMLCGEIRRVWQENFQVYGVRKVWRQLAREGIQVARCTVERLMKKLGLRGVRRGRFIRTTVGDSSRPCPLDRVQRQFKAERQRRSNGSIGSITGGYLSPSATFHLPRRKQLIMQNSLGLPSWHDSSKTVSAIPGAVHQPKLPVK